MLIPRRAALPLGTLLLVAALLLGLAATVGARMAEPSLPLARVEIAGRAVLAEVPRGMWERYRGLGGRRSLAPGRGMLFFFYKNGSRTMCMRDMNFALDFIWLARGRVSEISARVPPGGDKLLVDPKRPADLVLEVPAGWASANRVRPGDPVSIVPLGQDFPPDLKQRLIMERDEPR